MEDGTDPSSAFLDALRTRAMDEMHEAALDYGIVLKDLGMATFPLSKEIGIHLRFISCHRPPVQR